MYKKEKIKVFTDLIAWQTGHTLVLSIYEITKKFPKAEEYGLTSQIRRAAVSITSNIAEGYCRHSRKEKIQFYYLSLGSLSESQNQLIIAKDLGYISKQSFDELLLLTENVHRLIYGMIRYLS